MKKITLNWSQNRKAPNKAIDALRTELADFCQLFNSAPFEIDIDTVEHQINYVVNVVHNAIERMERISRVKKGALRMSLSRPNEGLKERYIWLIWGTDNGGCNLGTIVMMEAYNPKKIDVFAGPPESGKTRRAHELYDGKKAAWVDGRSFQIANMPRSMGIVKATDEVIIIDDLPPHLLGETVLLLSLPELTINPKGEKAFTIPTPKIVITCEKVATDSLSFRRRVNVVEFPLRGGDEL